MKNNIVETGVTVGLIIVAMLLLNPFHFWMPTMMVMGLLAMTLALFAVLASFIVRERAGDEREGVHRTLAGRNAFLAGAGVLTLGIVVQGYMHHVDPWLVIALIVMVVVKMATRMWSDTHL